MTKNILLAIYYSICAGICFYWGFDITNPGAAALTMMFALLCSFCAAGHWLGCEWKPKKEAGKVFSKGSQGVDSRG